MKVLRATVYDPPYGDNPVTMVMDEESIEGSIEDAAEKLWRTDTGVFCLTDVFDSDAATLVERTIEGQRRFEERRERERYMAISFYWNAAHLPMVMTSGILVNPRPAPLTAGEIALVLSRLAEHPNYENQQIVCQSEDGAVVTRQGEKLTVVR